jgi:hypothetical protein
MAFCSRAGGITRSEPVDTDQTGRIGKETGLISGISDYNFTDSWPNGDCRVKSVYVMD